MTDDSQEAHPGDTSTAVGGAGAGPPFDVTLACVGTSVTWGTGNNYENKFVDLVHRDLNGGYPLDEKYLHFNPGPNEKPDGPRYPYEEPPNTDFIPPTPSYYEKTVANKKYRSSTHPRGPHIPPSRHRARGGGIIGLDWPAKVEVGSLSENPPCEKLQYDDDGNYLAKNSNGSYDGKLDGLGMYASLDPKYSDLFSKSDINRSKWLLMRDIGWHWPTIVDQIDQFKPGGPTFTAPTDVPEADQPDLFNYRLPKTPPDGEDVDLVIMDGGTNDMQLGWLNDPTKASLPDIKEAAKTYFYENMTGTNMPGEKGLLRRARERFPNAVIVLLGYPVWTSNRTDIMRARQFLSANNLLGGAVVEQAIDNPLNFSHFQAHFLRKAVAEVARDDDGPGIIFAPPGYGVINAMMADWPWSFGVLPNPDATVNITESISIDDTHDQRVRVCEAEAAWEEKNTSDSCEKEIGGDVACPAAGVGHPNNEGSRQYADTIVRRYKEFLDLSVGDNADELDDGTRSLRSSLEQYGIGPGGEKLKQELSGSDVGTRWALSHRVIDSIEIITTTDQPSGASIEALTTGRPYLGVRPGRRGEAGEGDVEQFALDTESRDYVGTDEFYIDPMMRRGLTGLVGNVDEAESAGFVGGVKAGISEPATQTVQPLGHWSDRRLRLGMVDHLTLVLEDSGGWDLESVKYQLNGAIEGRRILGNRFDYEDFKSTVRPREFQVASFNDVEGASASDLNITSLGTGFDGSFGSPAEFHLSYGVKNTSDVRIPSVLLQYGWRLSGQGRDWREGRDWQVTELGDIPAGESRGKDVVLKAKQDSAFRSEPINVHAGVFVGDSSNWTSFTTSRGELSDL